MKRIGSVLGRHAKAIAAFIATAVAMLWLKVSGHDLDPQVEKVIEALIVALIVYAVPNWGA